VNFGVKAAGLEPALWRCRVVGALDALATNALKDCVTA
jgi:hypothetical protein